jgi:hypothetical protein
MGNQGILGGKADIEVYEKRDIPITKRNHKRQT